MNKFCAAFSPYLLFASNGYRRITMHRIQNQELITNYYYSSRSSEWKMPFKIEIAELWALNTKKSLMK